MDDTAPQGILKWVPFMSTSKTSGASGRFLTS
jgi:hypothetical protein